MPVGERLYLSHRTIGITICQIFPTLSITSRAALRDALGGFESPEVEEADARD